MMHQNNIGGAHMPEFHSSKINPEQRRLFWKEHIDRWQQSGTTQVAYCREHDLKPHQLTYWKKRFIQNVDATVSFVPLRFSQNPSANIPGTSLNLFTSNGYKIEVGADFDPVTLKQLITVVQSI